MYGCRKATGSLSTCLDALPDSIEVMFGGAFLYAVFTSLAFAGMYFHALDGDFERAGKA